MKKLLRYAIICIISGCVMFAAYALTLYISGPSVVVHPEK